MKKWGKGKVRRLLGTGAGLIFKGSGFYVTDYRSEGYKQAAKKESPSGSEGSSAGEGSKPAEKKAPEASKAAKSSRSEEHQVRPVRPRERADSSILPKLRRAAGTTCGR